MGKNKYTIEYTFSSRDDMRKMKKYILDTGLPPRKYQFTKRNRIIAALSKQLYVVGIGRNSGALSTIEAAKQYNVPFEVDGL